MDTPANDTGAEVLPLVRYDVTEAALAELREQGAAITEATTAEGYAAAQSIVTTCRKLRGGVDRKRKELNEKPRQWIDRVNSEAKRITAAIDEIEAGPKALRDAEDERRAQAKREKEEAERRTREAEAEAKLAAEREELARQKADLEAAQKAFAEKAKAAAEREAKEKAERDAAERAEREQREAEERAERERITAAQRAEDERLAEERRKIDAEKAELARAKAEREARERAEQEARDKAERERREAEGRARQEAERLAQLERERPQLEQLAAYVVALCSVPMPDFSTEYYREAVTRIRTAITDAVKDRPELEALLIEQGQFQ